MISRRLFLKSTAAVASAPAMPVAIAATPGAAQAVASIIGAPAVKKTFNFEWWTGDGETFKGNYPTFAEALAYARFERQPAILRARQQSIPLTIDEMTLDVLVDYWSEEFGEYLGEDESFELNATEKQRNQLIEALDGVLQSWLDHYDLRPTAWAFDDRGQIRVSVDDQNEVDKVATLVAEADPVQAAQSALSLPFVPETTREQERLVDFYPEFGDLSPRDVALLVDQGRISDPIFLRAWRMAGDLGWSSHVCVGDALRAEARRFDALAARFDDAKSDEESSGPTLVASVDATASTPSSFDDDLFEGRIAFDCRIELFNRTFSMAIFSIATTANASRTVYLDDHATRKFEQRLAGLQHRFVGDALAAARQTLLRSLFIANQ